jgi:hypothetical protein
MSKSGERGAIPVLTEVVTRGDLKQLPLEGVDPPVPESIPDLIGEPAELAPTEPREPPLSAPEPGGPPDTAASGRLDADDPFAELFDGGLAGAGMEDGDAMPTAFESESTPDAGARDDYTDSGEDLPASLGALETLIDEVMARHLAAARLEIVERLAPLLSNPDRSASDD